MKRSTLRTALRIYVLPGLLGLAAVGHTDQTITVSKTGGADFGSITEAYNYMLAQTGGRLLENWSIEVLDASVYDESVVISDLGTSSDARLTICSSDPPAVDKPTIYPHEDAARPITVHGTDFVTISGFIFKLTFWR